MKRSISGGFFFVIAGLILFSFSCTPQACLENTESYMKASFYDSTAKKLLGPLKLTLYGLNNDSLIYNNAARVQPALIPLNASADSSVFIIKINGIADTIKFLYNSYPHLVSKECGYTLYHRLDTTRNFSKHAIKGIYYINTSITTTNEENIRIFY